MGRGRRRALPAARGGRVLKISALIVSYDTRDLLDATLRRVRELPDAPEEILVVDNASSDGSPERVAREHPDVRLLALDENVGFGAANNRAAEVATGDALLLLNSDAWPEPGCLDRLRRTLEAEARTGAVAPRLRYPDGRPQFTWIPDTSVVGEALQKLRNPWEGRAWNHGALPALLRAVGVRGWLTAACLLVRREAWDAIGGFDERFFLYFEDVDLGLRLRRTGWASRVVPESGAVHLKGGSGEGGTGPEYRRAQRLFYALHRPAWEQRLVRRRIEGHVRRETDPERRARLSAVLEDPLPTGSPVRPAPPADPAPDEVRPVDASRPR